MHSSGGDTKIRADMLRGCGCSRRSRKADDCVESTAQCRTSSGFMHPICQRRRPPPPGAPPYSRRTTPKHPSPTDTSRPCSTCRMQRMATTALHGLTGRASSHAWPTKATLTLASGFRTTIRCWPMPLPARSKNSGRTTALWTMARPKPGGLFVKLGVGVLRKKDDSPYKFMYTYPLVDGGKWTVHAKPPRGIFPATAPIAHWHRL